MDGVGVADAHEVRVVPKLAEGNRVKSQGAAKLSGKERFVPLSPEAISWWRTQAQWRADRGKDDTIAFPAPENEGRWHKMGDKCIPAAPNQLLTGILASIMQSSCLFQAQSCGQCGMRPPLHVCSPRCRLRCLRPNEDNSFGLSN